jgi:hypothetical protein
MPKSNTWRALSALPALTPTPITKPAPVEKPTIFDKAREGELDKQLGQIHDRAEGKTEAALAQKEVPSAKLDSFDSAFAKTYDFLHSTEAEKSTQRDASKLVETVRENAKKFGVALDDQAALEAAMRLEERQSAEAVQAGERGPLADHMRSAFRDSSPVESAKWFSQVKANFEQDPIGTLAYLAAQTGMSPLQAAQAIAQRFGNQAPQQQQFQSRQQAEAAVMAMIDRVVPELENFSGLEGEIEEVLGSAAFKRTGNYESDLKAAYKEARRRDAKLSKDDRMEKSMRRIYDKNMKRA